MVIRKLDQFQFFLWQSIYIFFVKKLRHNNESNFSGIQSFFQLFFDHYVNQSPQVKY